METVDDVWNAFRPCGMEKLLLRHIFAVNYESSIDNAIS